MNKAETGKKYEELDLIFEETNQPIEIFYVLEKSGVVTIFSQRRIDANVVFREPNIKDCPKSISQFLLIQIQTLLN